MSFKICSQCQTTKPEAEFNFKIRAKNIRHSYCKECGKIFTQNHYRNKKELYLRRNMRSYVKRRQTVVEAKQRPCADCGVEYPYYVMDFDHREEAVKKFSLSNVHYATQKAILDEIAKCDVVCANCHRERTHQRRLKNLSKL